MASTGPALYGGPGAVTDYPSNGGASYAVTASTPAHAGDTVTFCALGLGAVSPPVMDGGLPVGLANIINKAQVQIGSQTTAAVFSGLNPQYPRGYTRLMCGAREYRDRQRGTGDRHDRRPDE